MQRQLATIKHQKEKLIKDIVENEKVRAGDPAAVEAARPGREVERLAVFLCELEKVVLLLLSLCWRLVEGRGAQLRQPPTGRRSPSGKRQARARWPRPFLEGDVGPEAGAGGRLSSG